MTTNGVPTPFMGSGVKQDLHLLFEKFSAVESIRIRDFAEVFRESKFETILHHKINPPEYVEFAEYLLQNCAMFFGKENEIRITRSFKERIFGIYSCYAFYSLQPVDHVCQIPITQLQFEELMEFQHLLAAQRALEPLSALKTLLLKKAFRIMVFQSTYDPATHKKYLAEEDLPELNRKPVEPFSRLKTIQSHQSMGELDFIHKAYTEAKKKLGITDVQLVEKINPVEEIEKILEIHQNILETNLIVEEEETWDDVPESAGASRSTLRSKAYSAGLKHTRHRRHLDPNMHENFKHLTFGQIAQECLDEDPSQPSTSTRTPRQRKRKVERGLPENLMLPDEDELAQQVLRDEYAARIKPELPAEDDEVLLGKRGRQGTSGVAKIRAPKRKNGKLIEVKSEKSSNVELKPTPVGEMGNMFESPTKKGRAGRSGRKETKPRINNEWASRLNAWKGEVAATDRQVQRLKSQIKIEHEDNEH